MKSEPAAEASPAAIATDTTADEVDVKSAPAENFESPVPSPTDAISTGESGNSVICIFLCYLIASTLIQYWC